MQKKDPTEDVMAAIARIVENPSSRIGSKGSEPTVPFADAPPQAPAPASVDDSETGANGYSRLGPGPLAALRFKWTARRDPTGDYYVDETIGEYSRPVSTGPMTAEESIAFVDKQVKEARERFDRLKADMSVKAPDPDPEPDASA